MIFKIILILTALILGAAIVYDRLTGRKVTKKILWPIILGFSAVVVGIMVRGFIE
tara:strand:- start:376 stop:540 length:165 start_codon:yes stop_codon:yes gene_type:complete